MDFIDTHKTTFGLVLSFIFGMVFASYAKTENNKTEQTKNTSAANMYTAIALISFLLCAYFGYQLWNENNGSSYGSSYDDQFSVSPSGDGSFASPFSSRRSASARFY